MEPGSARLAFGTFLDQWLEAIRPTVRPRTFVSYSDTLRLHVRPDLGSIALTRLTASEIYQLLGRKLSGGLSPRTVQYIHAIVRRALGHAEKWGLVPRNVARLVEGPRVRRPEIAPLTPGEVRHLLAFVQGTREEALYTVAIAMGLRQGETLGLRWSDLDLQAARLTVRHSLQFLGRTPLLLAPKTTKSCRTLAMPAPVASVLREHRRRQLEERLAAGSAWHDLDYVFPNEIGEPQKRWPVTRRFQRTLEAAGIRRQRFHDLRHACASLLLAQGVPLRVVQEILGHSQLATTADVYTHVIPTLVEDAAVRMGEVLTATP